MLRQHLDPNLHLVASSVFGLRFAFENQHAGLHLTDGWWLKGHNKGWAEYEALEIAIYWLIQMGIHDADITVHSDARVIGAFSNGRSCNPTQNNCIHRNTSSLIPACITSSPKYVSSSEHLTDLVSCSHIDNYMACLNCNFPLPMALSVGLSEF